MGTLAQELFRILFAMTNPRKPINSVPIASSKLPATSLILCMNCSSGCIELVLKYSFITLFHVIKNIDQFLAALNNPERFRYESPCKSIKVVFHPSKFKLSTFIMHYHFTLFDRSSETCTRISQLTGLKFFERLSGGLRVAINSFSSAS